MVEMLQRPPITVPDLAPRISMILPAIFRHAFDPNDEDYWGEPPADKATQRTVERPLSAT